MRQERRMTCGSGSPNGWRTPASRSGAENRAHGGAKASSSALRVERLTAGLWRSVSLASRILPSRNAAKVLTLDENICSSARLASRTLPTSTRLDACLRLPRQYLGMHCDAQRLDFVRSGI